MPAATIDEVIEQLDEVIERARRDGSRAGDRESGISLMKMDAGLEIQEQPRQVRRRPAPVDQQLVTDEADQHRAHAEIDVAGGLEAAHAGVDQREARGSVLPAFEVTMPNWSATSNTHARRFSRRRRAWMSELADRTGSGNDRAFAEVRT